MWFGFGGGSGVGRAASGGSNAVSKERKGSEESKSRGEEDAVDGFYEGDENKTQGEQTEEKEEEHAEDFDFSEEAGDESPTADATTTKPSTKMQTTAKQFVEWLPTFYHSVLELLAEERRQSRLVFGAELSPSIVARVLMECFRPIVSSFEKRLGNLYPPPKGGGGGSSSGMGAEGPGMRGMVQGGVGSLEAIAAAYESTIQFLSLAYDQMELWDGQTSKDQGGDNIKNKNSNYVDNQASTIIDPSTLSKPQPSSLTSPAQDPTNEALQSIRSAFLLVASPFLPYQRALAEAERHPMGEATSMVAKDVRGVVNFEDAAERLGDLAPFMFPLAEGEWCFLVWEDGF